MRLNKLQDTKTNKIRISFDAMGGDYAPFEIVKGALLAAQKLNITALLVGKEDVIQEAINKLKAEDKELRSNLKRNKLDYQIIPAKADVGMDEKNPARAVKSQKDSSIVIANQLVDDGDAEAVIAAGNTGAATAASLFILRRIKGFERPCIATLIPTIKSKMYLIDAGSNIEASPKHILQNALLGTIMAKAILKRANPRVGLLNVGGEPGKGSPLYKEAYELLQKAHNNGQINFVGNVEGKTIIADNCDIAVCDGFAGNIHLKALEGGLRILSELLKHEIKANPLSILAGLLLKAAGVFDRIKAHVDPSSYGGALLGGVNKISIISHGSSNAEAILNAARQACTLYNAKVLEQIRGSVS